MKGVKGAIVLAALLAASSAWGFSQQRAETTTCTCDNPQAMNVPPGVPPQIQCEIRALSLPVRPGTYRICYSVFGNSWNPGHDGVNSWVGGLASQPFIAAAALPPSAIGLWRGSTGLAACENVAVDKAFTATFNFAFYNPQGQVDEHWGCGLPKNPGVPSWLTVEPLP